MIEIYFKIFIIIVLVAIIGLFRRVIMSKQIIIDSLRDRIQMKNETIELLRAKLKEKEK
jgi:hypothetical protein